MSPLKHSLKLLFSLVLTLSCVQEIQDLFRLRGDFERVLPRSSASVSSLNLGLLRDPHHTRDQERFQPERKCSSDQRLQHIERTCRSLYGSPLPYDKSWSQRSVRVTSRNLYVIDDLKLLVCVPFKSGSTSMFHLLALITSRLNNNNTSDVNMTLSGSGLSDKQVRARFGIRSMSDLSASDADVRLRSFAKVLVVRHPLVRVLSFFADKLRRRRSGRCVRFYQNDIGRRAILWRRGELTSRDAKCADSLRFEEFVEFFAASLSTLGSERHLVPASDWCAPCHIKYDYVMKLETGARDQARLLRDVIRAPADALRPDVVVHRNARLMTSQQRFERSNFSLLLRDFRDVRPQALASLVKFYSRDLQLFGYSAALEASRGLRVECVTSAGRRSRAVEQTTKCC